MSTLTLQWEREAKAKAEAAKKKTPGIWPLKK